MTKETLQQKIEAKAKKRAIAEYSEFVKFMETNQLCKLLKFKKSDKLVPFCGNYQDKPLFETGLENKMEETDLYTNFNEARKELLEIFIEQETNDLLKKIDSLSDYFKDSDVNF